MKRIIYDAEVAVQLSHAECRPLRVGAVADPPLNNHRTAYSRSGHLYTAASVKVSELHTIVPFAQYVPVMRFLRAGTVVRNSAAGNCMGQHIAQASGNYA